MKTIKKIVLLVLFFIVVGIGIGDYASAVNETTVVKGELNLQHWVPPESSDIIALDGEWEFYWKKLLSPEQLQRPSFKRSYASAPSEWSKMALNGQSLTKQGFATYRLSIHLNEKTVNQQLALYIPASCSAYKVWVHNKEVAASGVVGFSKDTEKPWTSSRVVYFTPFSKNVEIVVQISNFHQRKNGMWDSFLIGNANLITKKDSQDYASQLIMIGSFMVMSIFYFFTYFFRRVNVVALYFSAVCLMISVRLAVIDGYILRHFIPHSLFEVVLKLEYLSMVLFCIFLMQYLAHVFPQEKNSLVTKILLITNIVYAGFVVVTPAIVYTQTLKFMLTNMVLIIAYHVLYVYPLAVIRKRAWAKLNLVASLVVIGTYINDIVYYTGDFSGIKLAYAGFFTFFLVQIVTMANQMSNAYKQLEVVSNELLDLNANLEQMVKDRTCQLEQLNEQLATSNEKLQKIEQSRRKFLSNISHDLGTPMQSAMGYVEMLMKGLIKDNQQKYLQIVYDKLTFIKKLSSDLFELTKVEEKQIVYTFVETDIRFFLEETEKSFALDFERKGISFELETIQGLVDKEQAFVKIDVFRMGQAFQNLLQNAMKFTLSGGSIRIQAEVIRNAGKIVIRVIDTGVGIDEELLPKVFERFVKGDEARTLSSESGIGLGLSIVREIVLAHDGEIFVSSEKDNGSMFSIVLPVKIISS